MTVDIFAKELKIPVGSLLEQMRAAGIEKKSGSDSVTDIDKLRLLNYLRGFGKDDKTKTPKITLTRKSSGELFDGEGNRKIQVEVRKKRVFVKRDESEKSDHESVGVTNMSIASLNPQITQKQSKAIRWSKLKSVEIKNFKAIDQIKVPLADVTVMVGPNGSGKSSILQAIHWSARAASYIPPQSQSEVVSFERLDYSPSCEPLKTAHKTELSSDRGTPPTMVTFNHDQPEDGVASAANIKIWAARNRGGISVHIDGGAAVTPFKQRDEVITAYIPGLAGLSEKETILVQPLLRRQAASGDAGGVLRNVLFNIASRQPGETDNEAATQRVKRLNELVRVIHHDVQLEVSFNDREDINIQALFDDKLLSGVRRPLETAATGVLQVIQIFAYLILFRPKLLLIDEPDAHLHPDKQERLIEALEEAAAEFKVQVILTTHSPHIARAASPSASLLWINQGKVVEQEDDTVRTLLGWGGLDKKVLFFIEDEEDQALRAILRQWPHLNRQIAICRCFGIDNLPKNSMLNGLLSSELVEIKILIHRDRDFMTPTEVEKWSERYNKDNATIWVTKSQDVEGYYCQSSYLSKLYEVSEEVASGWIKNAVSECKNSKKVFFEKRKIINKILYEDGGSPESNALWGEMGDASPDRVLGKTLHKALKVEVKKNGMNERKLCQYLIPKEMEMASELKKILEELIEN